MKEYEGIFQVINVQKELIDADSQHSKYSLKYVIHR